MAVRAAASQVAKAVMAVEDRALVAAGVEAAKAKAIRVMVARVAVVRVMAAKRMVAGAAGVVGAATPWDLVETREEAQATLAEAPEEALVETPWALEEARATLVGTL